MSSYMEDSAAQFTSKSHEWGTPKDLFDKLNEEFHFTLDPCASKENAKCNKFYTIRENGLAQDWSNNIVFCNPPYGNQIAKWVRKSYFEAQKGAIVVMLIPSRTDTKWWHEFVFEGEVRFIKGRLKFSDGKQCAPFASCLVIFR